MSVAGNLGAVYTGEMLTAGQIRAARAMLGWKQKDLAAKSGMAEITIKKIEGGTDARGTTLDNIRLAFWNAGVEFVAAGEPSGDGGPGVRMRPKTQEKVEP